MKTRYAILFLVALCASAHHAAWGQCTTNFGTIVINTVPRVYAAPLGHTWTNAWPPTGAGTANTPCVGQGSNCNTCPSEYTATITATQSRVGMYLCRNQTYTFSLCGSVSTWPSQVTLTTQAAPTVPIVTGVSTATCGDGHTTVSYTPPTSGSFFIFVSNAGCTAPQPNSTLRITCSQAGCAPDGNDPCPSDQPNCNPNFTCPGQSPAAPAFPSVLTDECTTRTGSTAGASTSNPAGAGASVGGLNANADVWFRVTSSPTATLALDVDHVSATNLAMALYSYTGSCPNPTLTLIGSNLDRVPVTDLSPFLAYSGAPILPNTEYYVRIWAETTVANGGTFNLCAYWPTPPPNDQPCGAITLDMSNPGCVPALHTTQEATLLSGNPGIPAGCGTAGRDVWFRIVVPSTGLVNINTLPDALNSMTMAVYTGLNVCPGALTLSPVYCSNPGTGMPSLANMGPYTAGTVLWVRLWSKTISDGTFQICAFMTQPPPNDDPCGATPFPVRNGCMMGVISTDLASQTAISTYGANTVPNPSCGGAPLNDVWFTAVVPASGKLTFDMDDYQMNDAALAVYRRTGTCPTPTFAQVAGACFFGGSTNAGAGNMPRGTVTGLTPGETVYIRVWREAGSAGNAYLCIQDPDPPPVTSFDCYLTLRMNDTGGNGWNGSRVTINNLTAGTGPVDYTILSGSGFINIPVGHTDNILVSYTAVGGFQNEISFTIVNQNNSLVFSSANPPVAGINWNGDVSCAAAVVPIGDCAGAYRFCSAESINYSDAMNPGLVNDLAPALNNRGCMSSGERAGAWFKLTANGTGTLAFTITPGGSADYDFAVWGPNYGGSICPPPGPPIRCSWAAGSGPTGLSASAADNTEGAGGDRWVSHITNVQWGEYYWFYVDNYSMNGVTFSFSLQGTAPISCDIAPVDLIDFNAHALQREVEVYWATSAERASSHFIVERSADGATFEPIGRVNAQGDAVGRTEYKFWDRAPLNGINYYRLRQVDKDDSEALSQAVAVMFQNGAAVLQVFPNPATDVLSTSVGTAVEGDIAWRVLDASGRIALEGTTKRVLHGGLIEMPISPLDGGSYLLELRTDDGSSLGYARFVKQ